MDWPLRDFCKIPIWFQGRRYFLQSKRLGGTRRATVYELWPWPVDLHEASPNGVVYDSDYVIARDAAAARRDRNEKLHLMLLPFYPLLGLFWSGFKNSVLCPIGFEPGSITRASVVLTANLFIAEGIFVGWLAGGILMYFVNLPALRIVDWGSLLILGADAVMRFGQSLKFGVERHYGFCEWLWPGRS